MAVEEPDGSSDIGEAVINDLFEDSNLQQNFDKYFTLDLNVWDFDY